MLKFKKIKIVGVILFIGLFYVLFPTNNSSLDAYAYGAFIKFDQNIFSHHHLLQNYLILNLNKLLIAIGIKVDILSFCKLINSIFVMLNLGLLSIVLNSLRIKKREIILLLFFVGFSFNFWRYGTENEVYIVPVFFSLLSSLLFLKFVKKEKPLIKVFGISFIAALACLFHQVHFFWWLGLFLGLLFFEKKNKVKIVILYILGSLIVPIIYSIVIFQQEGELSINNFFHFIFYAFYGDSVQSGYDLLGLFLTFVGYVRSFVQIHPSILFLIKKNTFFIIPGLIIFTILLFIIVKFRKEKFIFKRDEINSIFLRTHFIIFIFYLLFSHYCYGNIEFIVGLPVLFTLTILYRYKFKERVLALICLMFFVWNFSYGIYPNNTYSFYGEKKLVDFISKHPNDFFAVKDLTILNSHYYNVGIPKYEKIIIIDHKTQKESLIKKVKGKEYFFTNIIVDPNVFNRSSLTIKIDETLFKGLKKEKVFEYSGLYGKTEVHKIYLKE